MVYRGILEWLGLPLLELRRGLDPDKCSRILKADGCECLPPAVEDIRLFRVDGSRFLKLHVGTWRAAPLFKEPYMEFYNLELSNTNESANNRSLEKEFESHDHLDLD